MITHRIALPGTTLPPLEQADPATLPVHLTVLNSPLLFGCRSGLCGTCLIEVEALSGGELEAPDEAERDALEIYAPGNPQARLACQLVLTADVRIRKIESA